MDRENLSLRIAPQIGGRILSLDFAGRELLFTQPEHSGETFSLEDVEDLRAEKRKMGFRLWGGDKTWIAPQSGWWEGIPPLDLDAGVYVHTMESGRIHMRSPLCRETGLELERIVELLPGGKVLLLQSIRNASDVPIRRGIWDVTQFLRPFDLILPTTEDRIRAYPEEGDSIALRERMVHEGPAAGSSRITCNEPRQFKYGGMLSAGWLFATRTDKTNPLGHLRTFPVESGASYAHNAMFEIYNSPSYDYLEVEVHSPFTELQPGETTSHDQTWYFAEGKKGQSEWELLEEMLQRAGK